MNLLQTEEVASVTLFDLRASEGEVQYLALALEHLLGNLDDAELHALFTENEPEIAPRETREFAEDTLQELIGMLRDHSHPEYLPARLKERLLVYEPNNTNGDRLLHDPRLQQRIAEAREQVRVGRVTRLEELPD